MSNLGLGVMIQMMGGNAETVQAHNGALGKVIQKVELGKDDCLRIWFEDGTGIGFEDHGQSCCESRYMTSDDDLTLFVGDKFMGAEIKDAPSMEDEWGEHEVQFLEVRTDKGSFQMANHNEHNGYYGGFYIVVRDLTKGSPGRFKSDEA